MFLAETGIRIKGMRHRRSSINKRQCHIILPFKITQISHAPYKKIFCQCSVLKRVLFKLNAVFKMPEELEEYLLFHQIKGYERKTKYCIS